MANDKKKKSTRKGLGPGGKKMTSAQVDVLNDARSPNPKWVKNHGCPTGTVRRGGLCRKLAKDEKQTYSMEKTKGIKGVAQRLVPGGKSGYTKKNIPKKGWSASDEKKYQKEVKEAKKTYGKTWGKD